ncbi:MAG: DUF1963 domain-containing protein [Phycisphaerae bacterium]|nr:DUF1963 domain-containing protein [Phycisphaerae bacterium]
MTKEKIIELAKQKGFSRIDAIEELARPAVSFRPAIDPSDVPLSISRLGGLPLLPPGQAWPSYKGRSLAFIAQVALDELPPMMDQGFPARGLLSFFYNAEQSTWGFDPKDAGSFLVLYTPNGHDAVAAFEDWPEDIPEDARFPACGLAAKTTATIPPQESFPIDNLQLSSEQDDRYFDFLQAVGAEDTSYAGMLLGGYPDVIQGDIMLECALVSAGICCDGDEFRDPQIQEYRRESQNWRLLLQVPSCEEAGMMWGDLGYLYYCIHESDLLERRFGKSWMVLQCS